MESRFNISDSETVTLRYQSRGDLKVKRDVKEDTTLRFNLTCFLMGCQQQRRRNLSLIDFVSTF